MATLAIVRAPGRSAGPFARFVDALADLLAGGRKRRLRRAIAGFEVHGSATGDAIAARRYGSLVRLAARVDPHEAFRIVMTHDRAIPDATYGEAFPLGDDWLVALARAGDAGRQVAFELATRLRIREIQQAVAGPIANTCALAPDRDALLAHLERCRALAILDRHTVEAALISFLTRHAFTDHRGWLAFLAEQPDDLLPDLFAIHLALGRSKRAAARAATVAERRAALACCLVAKTYDDVIPAIALAGSLDDDSALRAAHEAAGDLVVASDPRAALAHYRSAGHAAKQSACHERLGEYFEALESCPDADTAALGRLADHCEPAIAELVRTRQRAEAIRRARQIVARFRRAVAANEAIRARLDRAERVATSALAAARKELAGDVERATADRTRDVLLEWSALEASIDEFGIAAELAERAGDVLQASLLWERDSQFGEAVRVLGSGAATPDVRARMARLKAEAGDHLGAARLYRRLGKLDDAIRAYEAAGALAEAAEALFEHLGRDQAIDSDDYVRLAARAGAIDSVGRALVEAVRLRPADARLTARAAVIIASADAARMSKDLSDALTAHCGAAVTRDRPRFDAAAAGIFKRAREEIAKRYALTWGFDLGTSKCVVAVYDTVLRAPVICETKGRSQFASSIAFDAAGTELVGLDAEELVRPGLRGAIVASKRQMGTDRRFRVGDRHLRPEEIAARLISHGRSIIEAFIRKRIDARAAELATAELGTTPAAWIEEASTRHVPAIALPDVVVTIPAHFGFKQKSATRDACEIAGVRLGRLVHEPTAACMVARPGGKDEETIVVVDLGAGTLDLSVLVVGDRVHEVNAVFGNNEFGGNDLDRAITAALIRKLEQHHGLVVPETGLARRRLLVAAEELKIQLSSKQDARYALPGFLDRDIDATLTAAELAATLEPVLAPLRAACEECRKYLRDAGHKPRGFVPVGGQMLSPIARQAVATALGLTAFDVDDARTLVARGAAIQAAILAGVIDDRLLLDVVPFSLGIKVLGGEFSTHIQRHTTIPTRKSDIYTTAEDNQQIVRIGVYQGERPMAEDNVKVGEFLLEGIPIAAKGTPKIEVTFDIDASGVLAVSAVDKATGRVNTIRIEDTTMLSPRERAELVTRFTTDRAETRDREQLADTLRGLADVKDKLQSHDLAASFTSWNRRLTAYEAARHELAPTREDELVLVDMFRRRAETEAEATLAKDRVANLVREITGLLAEPAPVLARAASLLDRTRQTARDALAICDRLEHWMATLARIGQTMRDPAKRFAACHAAGDHAAALAAFAEIEGGGHTREVWEAVLECVAASGDRDRYRATFAECARALATDRPDFERLNEFCRRAQGSIAWVQTSTGSGSGFVVADRLVATAKHVIADARDIVVSIGGTSYDATRVIADDPSGVDLALIVLPSPVAARPMRLGFSQLVEVGEPVVAIGFPFAERDVSFHENLLVDRGIVNRFRGSDWRARIFELGIRAQPGMSGGPVFNDLGEVVGVVSFARIYAAQSEANAPVATYNSCHAVNVTALRRMIARAG